MNINRRDFFKVVVAGTAGALTATTASARPARELAPGAVGILYDATLCIGCKACEVACKDDNALPVLRDSPAQQAHGVAGVWDAEDDLNSRNKNKIKAYIDGSGLFKDREQDGYSFVKRACMHCVDPNCISACPVSALTKDPHTGIVRYDPDACIGCRYCQIACPFNIPKFEYDKPFPKIVKCEMCHERIAENGIPACCDACPTGASLFGRVADLRAEGHRRLALQPGQGGEYPLHSLDSGVAKRAPVADYYPKIYGETDAGGTQYLLMAGVPFEKLGLPQVGDESRARLSETIQHTLYQGMFAPTLLLGGLVYAAYRHTRDEHAEQDVAAHSPPSLKEHDHD